MKSDPNIQRIADLERQLAEAKEDARNWKAEAEDNLCGWRGSKAELAETKAENEAMRPMIEACRARYEMHNQIPNNFSTGTGSFIDCQCLTCQWYRDYLERKQP